MNLLEMLFGAMNTQSSVDNLAAKTGSTGSQISKLIAAALPILLKALTNNAQSQQGIASLSEALSQHTSTGNMADQIAEADDVDGGKILQHILGGNLGNVLGSLAGETGMEQTQVESALDSLAPALMSGLSAAAGQAQSQQADDGFDLGDLVGMFGGGQGGGGILSSLLGGAGARDMQPDMDGSDLLKALASFGK